jgi:hypothetical protein
MEPTIMTTLQRLCLYALSAVAILLLVALKNPEVDTIHPRYIVERGYEYLDTRAVPYRGTWRLKTEWTTIPRRRQPVRHLRAGTGRREGMGRGASDCGEGVMSIKKGNRRRCKRIYWCEGYINAGHCYDWKAIKASSRLVRSWE